MMTYRKTDRPEILSPAGDFECLKAALRFGADAVYLGGTQFGLRASAASFTPELLRDSAALAHQNGARVYVTCNTIPTNDEIDILPSFLRELGQTGIDSLIITDLGVLRLAREILPDVEIHISTQAGVVNYRTARELYEMGAKRVVLARELSLDQIAQIRDRTPPDLEIETFVHGAMCASFSGRCLLSDYMTGRDANRGECAQPCRWSYALMEEKRPGQYFPIEENEKGSYILNAKDLCMIRHLDALAAAGISSFKIEGRAKSSYYVSVVTNAYRRAIDFWAEAGDDSLLPEWIAEEVEKVSHRPYSTGFYFGRPENGQYPESGGYIRGWSATAIVEKAEEGKLHAIQKTKCSVGDSLELLEPGKKPRSLFVSALYNENGEPIESTPHPQMRFSFPFEGTAEPGSILRRQN